MADYAEKLRSDLPDQFKDRERIDALVSAVGAQLDELRRFFSDIMDKCRLAASEGVQLDRNGSKVGLTRKEAYALLRASEDELTDDLYRMALQYKILLNSSNCTYYEFMAGLAMIWSGYTVTYGESPEYPATILLSFPDMSIDDGEDHASAKMLSVKPAGVLIKWLSGFLIQIDESGTESIRLINVRTKIAIPFWHCRLLDGSYLLDGSCPLNADRRYALGAMISFPLGLFHAESSADMNSISFNVPCRVGETAALGDTGLTMAIPFWGCNLFDGSCSLDGDYLLDADRRYGADAGISFSVPVDSSGIEAYGSMTLLSKTVDYWLLDGSVQLGGTRSLDSVYKKEDIE